MKAEEPVLKTIKEAKMVQGIIRLVEYKRNRYGSDCEWVYRFAAMRRLKSFKPNTVRSFLQKLEKLKIIQVLPVGEGEEIWGGVFRFTSTGEEKIRRELKELIDYGSEGSLSILK